MRALSFAPALLAAAGLVLAGCGDVGTFADVSTSDDGSDKSSKASGGVGLSELLLRADGVLDAAAFRGVRRVAQLHGASAGVTPELLEVREEVAGNGVGQFAIDLLDVIALPSTIESSLFPVTHARSVDVYWRTRDFRIRGLALAEQNYTFTELPGTVMVAGYGCRRIDVRRNNAIGGRPGHYVIDIEPSTGFVLASRELDDQGQELHSMTYESISFRPDFTGLELRSGAFASSSLDLTSSLDGVVGFQVLVPDVLPQGFELAEAVHFAVPDSFTANVESYLVGGEWVRFTATDGIESVTFAHGSTMSATAGVVASSLRVVSEGAWEYGFGRVAGVSFVVAGRVDAQDLRRLVESAF